jgi:hypothetical protein
VAGTAFAAGGGGDDVPAAAVVVGAVVVAGGAAGVVAGVDVVVVVDALVRGAALRPPAEHDAAMVRASPTRQRRRHICSTACTA